MMHKCCTLVLAVLAAVLVLSEAVPVSSKLKDKCHNEFEKFKAKHSKVYATDEEHLARKAIFCRSILEIEEINSQKLRWRAGVNEYSDLTWEEFKGRFLMSTAQNCSATHSAPVDELVEIRAPPPEEWDWRKQTCGETSCVSMVKNQGNCGSCWTFSTVGAMESLHAIKTGMMVLLSEQQLVDCAQGFKNNGCGGGLPSQAFEYIKYNGGISKMESYPYVCGDGHCNKGHGMVGGPCKYNKWKFWNVGATVMDVANFTAGDEATMKTVVGTKNPVSVAFEVVSDLRHYASGVYSSTMCQDKPETVNHAVLAVGYGTEAGKPYWWIKNSWGFGWGDDGYFKIERNVNMCGIAVCSSFPITSDHPAEDVGAKGV